MYTIGVIWRDPTAYTDHGTTIRTATNKYVTSPSLNVQITSSGGWCVQAVVSRSILIVDAYLLTL